MTEQLAAEIWRELKRYINVVDRSEAAEQLINIMVDGDCDIEDIKTAFKGDSDIKKAITDYLDNDRDESDDEDDFDEDDNEDYWEN